jgi:hypothetical protein
MKKLIKEIQWMNNKKEHECVRFVSRIRRTNKKKTKNQIKFLHYQIFAEKTQLLFSFIIQQSKNRLKFWTTTTTFERRFVVSLVKNRFFSLFERRFRRSSRTSSKIECRFRVESRLRNDASLRRRNERRDFSFVRIKRFAERTERIA